MDNSHTLTLNDASWYQFRVWLEYFGKVFERKTIAITPNGTSQEFSNCRTIVKKSLSTGTHVFDILPRLKHGGF